MTPNVLASICGFHDSHAQQSNGSTHLVAGGISDTTGSIVAVVIATSALVTTAEQMVAVTAGTAMRRMRAAPVSEMVAAVHMAGVREVATKAQGTEGRRRLLQHVAAAMVASRYPLPTAMVEAMMTLEL